MQSKHQPLSSSFYDQPTLDLARSLLGCLLVKEIGNAVVSGYIVETEAYMGAMDQAAHSFRNRRTKRTEIMFGTAGHVYTYAMHRHTLINVVSGPIDIPQVVLIRALEPFEGLDQIEQRRHGRSRAEWTNGPGKLTEALGITREDYGHLLTEWPLYIAKGFSPESVSAGPRIGIENSGDARLSPWRFWVTDHSCVSHR